MTLTTHEQQEIHRANASGLQPVVSSKSGAIFEDN